MFIRILKSWRSILSVLSLFVNISKSREIVNHKLKKYFDFTCLSFKKINNVYNEKYMTIFMCWSPFKEIESLITYQRNVTSISFKHGISLNSLKVARSCRVTNIILLYVLTLRVISCAIGPWTHPYDEPSPFLGYPLSTYSITPRLGRRKRTFTF